jgi:hypothetical protein
LKSRIFLDAGRIPCEQAWRQAKRIFYFVDYGRLGGYHSLKMNTNIHQIASRLGKKGYKTMLRRTTKKQRSGWAARGGLATKKLWKKLNRK